MKLSTRGRYGLRVVLDIAVHAKEGPVSLASVAKRQELSAGYLEQIAARLKKAGVLTGARGAQGGYRLARAPEKISVGEVLRALEGELHLVDCASLETGTTCSRADSCVTKYVWKRISDSINNTVDSMSLAELLEHGQQAQ